MTAPDKTTMNSPKQTAKQSETINLLHRFRFLTSTQIKTLLNDKTTRLTNDLLKKFYKP
jgi:hypothetical protein